MERKSEEHGQEKAKSSASQENDLNAIEIAPPEVWSLILQKIPPNDASSKVACYGTCKMWESLLVDHRNDFLFYLVFPLIRKYLFKEEVNQNDIYNCRLVSRGWRFGVDNFFEGDNIDSFYSIDVRQPDHIHWSLGDWNYNEDFENLYTFYTKEKVENFLIKMSNCPADWNPILTKIVRFCGYFMETGKDNAFQMWELVTNTFLPMFGSYIQSCRFEFDDHYGPLAIRVVLLAALKHLPNLRVLNVTSGDWSEPEGNNYQELMEILGVDRFAQFPKLECLTAINVVGRSSSCLCTGAIGKYCSTESTISLLSTSVGIPEVADGFRRVSLPKLAKLKRLCLPSSSYLWDLRNIQNTPLQTLVVLEAISLEYAVQLTSHFKHTLQVLHVTLRQIIPYTYKNFEFDLPHLETLRFEFAQKQKYSIDFILPLSALKNLGVCAFEDREDEPAGVVVQFASHYHRMLDWSQTSGY